MACKSARVLLTTFSETLANALRAKLKRLLSSEPRLGERIDVYSLNAMVVWANGLRRTYGIVLAFWIGKRITGL
jgi:hypothetical protein